MSMINSNDNIRNRTRGLPLVALWINLLINCTILTLVAVLLWMSGGLNCISNFFKIHINTVNPPTPRAPKWFLSLRFPHQNPVYASPPPYALHALSILFFFLITQTILGEEHRSLSSSLWSFPHYPVSSSLIGTNIPLSTLCSNTFKILSSLNVSVRASHLYTRTGKIIVLCFLIFIFLNSKLQDKRFCTKW